MIHKQSNMPVHANVGDAWECPHKSFKRVLSRGGAWENVNLGETHRDEVEHEQQSGSEAEPGVDSPEISVGAGESTSGDGNDGETVSEPSGGLSGSEDPGVIGPAPTEEELQKFVQEGSGVDGNGSPVV